MTEGAASRQTQSRWSTWFKAACIYSTFSIGAHGGQEFLSSSANGKHRVAWYGESCHVFGLHSGENRRSDRYCIIDRAHPRGEVIAPIKLTGEVCARLRADLTLHSHYFCHQLYNSTEIILVMKILEFLAQICGGCLD